MAQPTTAQGEELRIISGRAFNSLCETYALPADDDEWTRLNKQHIAFTLGVGGLYPDAATVKAVLAPEDGKNKKILDLGYGTGIWSISMAKEFPHAQVTGIDLAPCPTDPARIPSNCHFKIGDINRGLEEYHNQYDFVHARLIGSGLRSYKASLEDMQKCLKPGGFLLCTDADFDFYVEEPDQYQPVATESNPNGSWLTRIIAEVFRAIGNFGGDLKGTAIAIENGLWDSPLIDPATCKNGSLYWTIGPWKDDEDESISEKLRVGGELLRLDLMKLYRGAIPVLMKAGWPKETLGEWVRNADKEAETMNPHLYGRTRFAWGRRRAAPNQPSPALPSQGTNYEPASTNKAKAYPLWHVYDTKEESLEHNALRNRGKGTPLPAYPS
ncbi:S-adenosyl-L-methionine-dependent methyltransferase [Serendipita vermifera]|nr:S-adenosyl-L-methionine-dependent methyltransferase [Serendipita vermifera]